VQLQFAAWPALRGRHALRCEQQPCKQTGGCPVTCMAGSPESCMRPLDSCISAMRHCLLAALPIFWEFLCALQTPRLCLLVQAGPSVPDRGLMRPACAKTCCVEPAWHPVGAWCTVHQEPPALPVTLRSVRAAPPAQLPREPLFYLPLPAHQPTAPAPAASAAKAAGWPGGAANSPRAPLEPLPRCPAALQPAPRVAVRLQGQLL